MTSSAAMSRIRRLHRGESDELAVEFVEHVAGLRLRHHFRDGACRSHSVSLFGPLSRFDGRGARRGSRD